MQVYAVVDLRSSPARRRPCGDVRNEEAERFLEKVRNDEPELASYLRIEERALTLAR